MTTNEIPPPPPKPLWERVGEWFLGLIVKAIRWIR